MELSWLGKNGGYSLSWLGHLKECDLSWLGCCSDLSWTGIKRLWPQLFRLLQGLWPHMIGALAVLWPWLTRLLQWSQLFWKVQNCNLSLLDYWLGYDLSWLGSGLWPWLTRIFKSDLGWLGHFKDFDVRWLSYCSCSGQKKPDSWGRHSEALNNLDSGNLEGGGLGKGLWKGRSVYKQPETKVDGSCHS